MSLRRDSYSSREGRNLNKILAIPSEKRLGGRVQHSSIKGCDSDRRSRAMSRRNDLYSAAISAADIQAAAELKKGRGFFSPSI